jgi:hypothetical protein
MRSTLIVVRHPLGQSYAQVFLAQRNHEIQTLTAYAAHQSFAIGVRVWCSRGGAQHPLTYLAGFFGPIVLTYILLHR